MDESRAPESLAPSGDLAIEHCPDEVTALIQFLDVQRLEFHRRAWGLTDEQLRMTTSSSSLTLGALVKHMALVESSWFEDSFLGDGSREPWASAPWDEDRDWEITTAAHDSGEELFTLFGEACVRSREVVAAAIATGDGLDQLSARPTNDGAHWNLRWIMVHMIEEYARHLGHADFLRESIDGVTGP